MGGPAPDFIDIKWSDGPPVYHRMTEIRRVDEY